ncbi:SMP-30/gluconolactonase/LRE family protein [Paraglaciecola aquimarina]|uniref:SMP-30/gluconolactonase/LRE family protein n=1 Tax=Paraglaciecola algarum TaxID=3050085 RepID=A0ABS9DAZ7_9ALTE|nr:SMP-30/gluconolactonase/LRE family protein [Paraglaciecola sp. G1-23]MCF2950127.1 SMP-30/gluconolactonase/LRE family protein [Paraglaciecola sp. G1-23]
MLALSDIQFFAKDLVRPECILATADGVFYTADFRGGVCKIMPNGEQQLILPKQNDHCPPLKPNGICLLENGDFLIAHLGDEVGGIYRLTQDGEVSPFVTHIDGEPLPPSNFIYLDHQDRLWLTVSTRQQPRAKAYRSDVSDGFVALIEYESEYENGEPIPKGTAKAKIVADNIGYTNEVYVTEDGRTLYVNATFTRETLSFDITANNQLINPNLVAKYGKGIFPDGLTMDTQGHLWVTSIVSNTVIRVNPSTGESQVILADNDPEHIDWVEEAYKIHAMGRPHLDNVKSHKLKNVSSLAFYGKNMTDIALGCLLGDSIPTIKTNFSGVKPAHWNL